MDFRGSASEHSPVGHHHRLTRAQRLRVVLLGRALSHLLLLGDDCLVGDGAVVGAVAPGLVGAAPVLGVGHFEEVQAVVGGPEGGLLRGSQIAPSLQ